MKSGKFEKKINNSKSVKVTNKKKLSSMVNLGILKKDESIMNLVSLEIGFSNQHQYKSWFKNFRSKIIKALYRDIFLSGVFKDFVSYNVLFLSLLFFIIFSIISLSLILDNSIGYVGINFYGDSRMDLLVTKNILLLIPFIYLLFISIMFFLLVRFHRTLKNFLVMIYFNLFVLSILLLLALVEWRLNYLFF